MLRHWLVGVVCCLGLGAGWAQGSGGSGGNGPVTTLQAESRAVVVDVVVTKGDGQPVTGLKKADFGLTEDGKGQAINFFEEHANAPVAAPVTPLRPGPNVFTPRQLAAPGAAMNLVLLDGINTPKADQTLVVERLIKFVKGMPEGTPLAIFSMGAELHLVQGFTSDRAVLLEALEGQKSVLWARHVAGERSANSASDDKVDKEITQEMTAPSQSAAVNEQVIQNGMVGGVERSQAQQRELQAVATAGDALTDLRMLSLFLARVPGRKNLIWFASNFPNGIVTLVDQSDDARDDMRSRVQKAGEASRSARTGSQSLALKEIADLLALSRVVIYPVDARGINGQTWMDAGNGSGMSFGEMQAENDASGAAYTAMAQWADATGGAVIRDNFMDVAMARAVDDGSHYYTLSYTPGNEKMDGKFRRIRVKLAEGGYHLEYRPGYYALGTLHGPQEGKADPLQALLLRGMPGHGDVPFEVNFTQAKPQPAAGAAKAGGNGKLTGATTRYNADFVIHWKDEKSPAEVKQDADQDWSPGANEARVMAVAHRDRLQVEVFAYDHEGVALNWVGGALGVEATAANYDRLVKNGVAAHMVLDIPAGDVYLAAGVYDWATGKSGTLEIPVSSLRAAQ